MQENKKTCKNKSTDMQEFFICIFTNANHQIFSTSSQLLMLPYTSWSWPQLTWLSWCYLACDTSPEVIVEEAFLDLDFEWTLACLFFSSDLANFLPQASHVNGFSPKKNEFQLVFTPQLICVYLYVFVFFFRIQVNAPCYQHSGWDAAACQLTTYSLPAS